MFSCSRRGWKGCGEWCLPASLPSRAGVSWKTGDRSKPCNVVQVFVHAGGGKQLLTCGDQKTCLWGGRENRFPQGAYVNLFSVCCLFCVACCLIVSSSGLRYKCFMYQVCQGFPCNELVNHRCVQYVIIWKVVCTRTVWEIFDFFAVFFFFSVDCSLEGTNCVVLGFCVCFLSVFLFLFEKRKKCSETILCLSVL